MRDRLRRMRKRRANVKPASDADAQKVRDAVAAGEAVPAGFAFDGNTVFVTDAADDERVAAGGPVMPPDYQPPPVLEPTAAATTTKPPK